MDYLSRRIDGDRFILRELSRCGKLQADYVIKKTLFGEHLLRYPAYAENVIGIVESEKSAVVCSLCFPNVLWMATGSKGNMITLQIILSY